MAIEVSIIVPCRNEVSAIAATVNSIRSQDPIDGDFEVIVADGMSDDGTREILSQLAAADRRITMVDNPEGIVSTGLNRAIRQAQGKIIIRMDGHTTYARDYVRRCVEVLSETHADNVGGPWVARGEGIIGRAIAAAFGSGFAAGGARSHDCQYEGIVDSVYLGCWRRELFERVGFFDETLVRNQDDEFNLRITRQGGAVWQSPRIKSVYSSRSSLRGLFKQYLQYGYWKVRVLQKHKIPASVRHLVPAAFLIALAGLPVMALWFEVVWWFWGGLLSLYMTLLLLASIVTASRQGSELLLYLPLVFACFHIGYGLGFLHGILDFVMLRRGGDSRYGALTRERTTKANGRVASSTEREV
jgi:glycosyltransferase involved in cell wall biosynthesis